MRLWDTTSGSLLQVLQGHKKLVQSVAFTPDGQRILSGGFDGLIHIWHVETGKLALALSAHNAGVLGIAFSPDGTWFVSASDHDGTLKIWDAGPVDEADRRWE